MTSSPAPEPEPGPKPGIGAQLSDFVNNMDARAWRAVAVTVALFVVVGAMLAVGRLYFGDEITTFVRTWLGGAERAHWGLPATILIFTLTSFVGAPQFVLIAACVVAFGPELGFFYAWIATVVSGAVNYWLGQLGGAATLKRFGGATGGRFTRFMGQNGFLASLLIRNVPSAPFIVVNMAFGATRVGFWPFIAGLALGVLPKTAIVAFFGRSVFDAIEGKLGTAALVGVAAIVIWIAAMVVIRGLVRKNDANTNA